MVYSNFSESLTVSIPEYIQNPRYAPNFLDNKLMEEIKM